MRTGLPALSALFVALAAGEVRGQNEMLFPGQRVALGGPSTAIAVGDLDLDGQLDLAYYGETCDFDAPTLMCWRGVFVRLARPGRTFGEPQFHLAGSQSWSAALDLVIRDLTQDGWPDLAFVDPIANALVVLPSLGWGAFGEPLASDCAEPGDTLGGLDFAELDGDGIPDAVVAVWTSGQSCHCMHVLRGTGTGSFAQTASHFMGEHLSHPTIRDLDGDGLLDLAAITEWSDIVVRLALPGGGYAQPVISESSPGFLSFTLHDIQWVDFDDDGLQDIVGGSTSSEATCVVKLLENVGGGSFALVDTITVLDIPNYQTGMTVAVADMTGDSRPDILAATPAIYSFSAAHKELADEALVLLEGLGGFSFSPSQQLNVADELGMLIPCDLDADGFMDLVYQASSPPFAGIRYGTADGAFDVGADAPARSPSVDIASGDLDGDGHSDLVLAHLSGDPGVSIQLGVGDGSFSAGSAITLALPVHRVLLADVSGDAKLDLVAASSVPGQTVHVMLGSGDGAFGVATLVSTETAADLELADLNGDGVVDLSSCDPSSQRVNVQLGLGQGAFASPVGYPSGGPSQRLSVGDLDSDGDMDLLVANPAPQLPASEQWTLATLLNDGAAAFAAPTLYPEFGTQDVAAADLDRDGIQDVVLGIHDESDVSHAVSNDIAWRRGLGGGLLGESISLANPVIPWRIETSDLNRDGWTDVVAAAAPESKLEEYAPDLVDGDSVGLVLGSPSAPSTLYLGVAVQAGEQPVAVAVADFNEDGFPDIAAAQSESPSVAILLNQSTTWATLGHDSAPPSGGSAPLLTGSGTPVADQGIVLQAASPLLQAGQPGLLVVGFDTDYSPFQGGVLVPAAQGQTPMRVGAPLISRWPKGIAAGTPVYAQALFALPDGDVVASNALVVLAQ